jgi:hypothetical protein
MVRQRELYHLPNLQTENKIIDHKMSIIGDNYIQINISCWVRIKSYQT